MFHVELGQLLGSDIEGLAYSDADEGNVFIDHLPSGPDRCLSLFVQPGGEADSKLPYDPIRLQVITRSEEGGVWALDTWATVYSYLQGKRNFLLPGGTYVISIIATQASPMPLGPDENGRYRYSSQYRAEIYHPTTERPA